MKSESGFKSVFFFNRFYIISASLRSKRFPSSYCAKPVEERAKRKYGRGRARAKEETLARKPHDSGKRPLVFHGSVHFKLTARQTEQITRFVKFTPSDCRNIS